MAPLVKSALGATPDFYHGLLEQLEAAKEIA